MTVTNFYIDWRARLGGEDREEYLTQIRNSPHRGQHLAGNDIFTQLEKGLAKNLHPKPVGRPKQSE